MIGVCGSGTYPFTFTDFEVICINDIFELIPTNMVDKALLMLIQMPQFHSTNPGINCPDLHNKLQSIGDQ